MKKLALYTLGFLGPVLALFVAQNVYWKTTRFEARAADGWIYVVDRNTGEVTSCIRRTCQVIRRGADSSRVAERTGAFDDLPPVGH